VLSLRVLSGGGEVIMSVCVCLSVCPCVCLSVLSGGGEVITSVCVCLSVCLSVSVCVVRWWRGYHVRVNRDTCSCGCWDAAFKGSFLSLFSVHVLSLSQVSLLLLGQMNFSCVILWKCSFDSGRLCLRWYMSGVDVCKTQDHSKMRCIKHSIVYVTLFMLHYL